MVQNFSVNVNSEIGELEAVILHPVGREVENMTPENAERALYSDILNLSVAKQEYTQLKEVLNKVCKVFEVEQLLNHILRNDRVKTDLIKKLCPDGGDVRIMNLLNDMGPDDLARSLIEGVPSKRETLSDFLSPQRYAIRPLHNFFFTRDASVSIGKKVMISKMASMVRDRETLIMEAIFDYYPEFNTSTFSVAKRGAQSKNVSIEGGDVLVARKDLTLIGIGSRTSPEGVDVVIDKMKEEEGVHHIIVQELPTERESFHPPGYGFYFLKYQRMHGLRTCGNASQSL